MSSPTSTKLWPPTYVDGKVRRRYMYIFILQMWFSLLPTAFLGYWFFLPPTEFWSFQGLISSVWDMPNYVFYFLIPIILVVIYMITVIWTALVTKVRIMWLNFCHKPIEGVFLRSMNDKDYVYWNKRNYARIFLFWVLYSVPFSFLKKTFSFLFFGVKIGKNTEINHCWISPEFITIGKNVKFGQSSAIYSFMYEGNKLIVAHTVIEDDVLIGPHVVLFAGSKVRKGVVLDGGGWGNPFVEYEADSIYHGSPFEKVTAQEQ